MSLRSSDSPLLMLLQAIWLLVVFVIPSKPKISERICCCRLLLPLLFVLFACALFSYSFAYNKIKDCVWDFVFADLKRKPSANKRSTALAMPYLLSPSPDHLQPPESAALLPWVCARGLSPNNNNLLIPIAQRRECNFKLKHHQLFMSPTGYFPYTVAFSRTPFFQLAEARFAKSQFEVESVAGPHK